jgi:hypothetical protein
MAVAESPSGLRFLASAAMFSNAPQLGGHGPDSLQIEERKGPNRWGAGAEGTGRSAAYRHNSADPIKFGFSQ